MGGRNSGRFGNSVKFPPEVRQKVIDMASTGAELFTIAKELGVTKRMLIYRCRKEIDEGREIAAMNGIVQKHVSLVNSREDVPEEARYQIETMAAYGLPVDQICTIMGMARMTLLAYCQEDIDRGRARGYEAVAGKLFEMAVDGEHPLQTQFYLKTRCGWKETTDIVFPDENGNPQRVAGGNTNINISADNLQSIIAVLNDKV